MSDAASCDVKAVARILRYQAKQLLELADELERPAGTYSGFMSKEEYNSVVAEIVAEYGEDVFGMFYIPGARSSYTESVVRAFMERKCSPEPTE